MAFNPNDVVHVKDGVELNKGSVYVIEDDGREWISVRTWVRRDEIVEEK